MALRSRQSVKWQKLNVPLSYRVNETRPRLQEGTQNVFDNQGRIDTRFGKSRYNTTSLGGTILSSSYFRSTSGNRYLIAKVGTVLYSVQETGAHTAIKTGLSATTKHRGITLNNRHIITVEGDGLFQFNGTTVTILGEAAPVGWSAALVNGQGSLSDGSWKVALTYYSSVTGFETNATEHAAIVTSTPNSRIAFSNIDNTPDNTTLDKMRIYASLDGGDFFFAEEVAIATSYNLDDDPESTLTPPTLNAKPQSGGGKYLTEFNRRLVYVGNTSFPNDVFFSEQDIPDGFDDTASSDLQTLFVTGDGEVTGIATGFYSDSNLDPYLVIFKRKSIHIFSEIGDNQRFVSIEKGIGCVSGETIIVRNGVVYFLSDSGWRAISNGVLIRDEKDEITLGLGDIDDLFKREGFDLEVTKTAIRNSFSCYYPDLDQYFTFIPDAQGSTIKKAYVFSFLTPGFFLYVFNETITTIVNGQDSDGIDQVFMGDSAGYFYTHSKMEDRNDDNASGQATLIDARARKIWFDGEDLSASFNFRDLFVRALNSDDSIDVFGYVNYSLADGSEYDLDFSTDGFRFDIDRFDIGILGDERQIITAKADINRVGENIAIEFRQKADNANMGLLAIQIDFSKNGNRN